MTKEFDEWRDGMCDKIQNEIDKYDDPDYLTYRPVGTWRDNWEEGANATYDWLFNRYLNNLKLDQDRRKQIEEKEEIIENLINALEKVYKATSGGKYKIGANEINAICGMALVKFQIEETKNE